MLDIKQCIANIFMQADIYARNGRQIEESLDVLDAKQYGQLELIWRNRNGGNANAAVILKRDSTYTVEGQNKNDDNMALLQALKLIGNFYIAELNEQNAKKEASFHAHLSSTPPVEGKDFERMPIARPPHPAYVTPEFLALPEEVQEAVKLYDKQLDTLALDDPDFQGKFDAILAHKDAYLSQYRAPKPAPVQSKGVKLTKAQAGFMQVIAMHNKQNGPDSALQLTWFHLSGSEKGMYQRLRAQRLVEDTLYANRHRIQLTDAGRAALAAYEARKGR